MGKLFTLILSYSTFLLYLCSAKNINQPLITFPIVGNSGAQNVK